MPNKPFTIYDMFETSEKLEVDGIILEYEFHGTIFEFTVARAGGRNHRFIEARDVLLKKLVKGNQASSDEFLTSLWAEACFKGWNVIGRDGEKIPFTTANVKTLMLELPDLFTDIRERSADFHEYRVAIVKAAEKNS